MRILFDQGTPVPLKQHLPSHQVETAHELGWSRLTNGELLAAAEGRFDVLITTDRNLRYQQSLSGRKLAVLVLPTTSWPVLEHHIESIVSALAKVKPVSTWNWPPEGGNTVSRLSFGSL
jgi:predicted nuclease of predicted toxin-antitoxin system